MKRIKTYIKSSSFIKFLSVLVFILVSIGLILNDGISGSIWDVSTIPKIASRILILIGILGTFILLFAISFDEGTSTREKRFGDLAEDDSFRKSIDETVKALILDHFNADSHSQIKRKISTLFDSGINDAIEERLTNAFSFGNDNSSEYDDISGALRYAYAMDEKYQVQVTRLTKQQNLSLVIGLIFAFVGGFVLVYSLFFGTQIENPLDLVSSISFHTISHYVTRVLTVIFIEIFAIFFLRNYRSIFSEVKFYQNERNILQSRIVALRVAISTEGSKELINRVFDSLISVDRESPLADGNSTETIELEKLRLGSEKQIFDLLGKAIEKIGVEKKD